MTGAKPSLAWICNIPKDHIIAAPNVDTIYRVPLSYDQQGLADKILRKFGVPERKADLKSWKNLLGKITTLRRSNKTLEIAVVGKYFETGNYNLSDVYISVVEALKHAGWNNNVRANLHWISSIKVEQNGAKRNIEGI